MKDYKVRIGFGLHVGWGIEGAIGSDFKIDASYLSPHVNMAQNLEGCTKQYGVPLLISAELFKIMSSKSKSNLRHLDTVTIKGYHEPLPLYTYDVDQNQLIPDTFPQKVHSAKDKKTKRVSGINSSYIFL